MKFMEPNKLLALSDGRQTLDLSYAWRLRSLISLHFTYGSSIFHYIPGSAIAMKISAWKCR